ncbi:MAG: hypothetical protein WBB28_25940 [Crinalium sp.]
MYKKGFFPVVLIPDILVEFCRKNPLPVLNEQSTTSNSTSLRVLAPLPPVKSSSYKPRYSFIFQCWLFCLIALVVVNWFLGFYLFNLLLAIASSIFVALSFVGYDYLIVRQLELEYQQKIDKYQQQLSEYSVQQALALSLKSEAKKDDKDNKYKSRYESLILKHQKQLQGLLIGKILLPSDRESTATQGASEAVFYTYLLRYFPDTFQGGVFPVPGKSFPYTADFRTLHKKTGLFIQVEVDEPYAFATQKPHHCYQNNTDEERNQFFLNGNWVIIRFAEQQIVTQPESCCKQIAIIIYQITGDSSFLSQLRNFPNVKPHKHWTEKEAKMMVKNNYRGTYLRNVKSSKKSNMNGYGRTKSRSNKKQNTRKSRR